MLITSKNQLQRRAAAIIETRKINYFSPFPKWLAYTHAVDVVFALWWDDIFGTVNEGSVVPGM